MNKMTPSVNPGCSDSGLAGRRFSGENRTAPTSPTRWSNMIAFRCWYCNRAYTLPEARSGERILCTCKNPLRIPKRSGGNCRIKTLVDRLVEAVVYGGGGGLLGFGLGALICLQVYPKALLYVGPALALPGFLIGLLGGE